MQKDKKNCIMINKSVFKFFARTQTHRLFANNFRDIDIKTHFFFVEAYLVHILRVEFMYNNLTFWNNELQNL